MLNRITTLFLLCCLCLGAPEAGASSAPAARQSLVPISRSTAEAMLGQMLMFGFRGTGPEDPAYGGDFKSMLDFVGQGKAGGVVLFYTDYKTKKPGRNISGPAQLKAMNAALQAAASASPATAALKGESLPLLIGVDQEGGRVRRLFPAQGFMDLPAPSAMGVMEESAVYNYGLRLGRELHSLGVNLNFAPSLDININPNNPVIGSLGRSFGSTPEQVILKAGSFGVGLTDAGVAACFKHFPGHGSSSGDSHLAFTDISKTWRQVELAPFSLLLNNPAFPTKSSYMVMPGHLFNSAYDDKHPASLSAKTVNGLLRGVIGWQGVVVSDDLQMKAVSDHYDLEQTILLSVEAGVDILLFGNNLDYDPQLSEKVWQTARRLLHEKKIRPERVAESYERIVRLKKWLAEQQ